MSDVVCFQFFARFWTGFMISTWSNKARACVKTVEGKIVNNQIYDLGSFDESSRWTRWSKNELSHSLALDRMTMSAVSRMFHCGRRWHAPRHRSALRSAASARAWVFSS